MDNKNQNIKGNLIEKYEGEYKNKTLLKYQISSKCLRDLSRRMYKEYNSLSSVETDCIMRKRFMNRTKSYINHKISRE